MVPGTRKDADPVRIADSIYSNRNAEAAGLVSAEVIRHARKKE